MPTSKPKLILLDNTVLSNFAIVNRTDIVLRLWNASSTTPDAWQEFQSGFALGYLPQRNLDSATSNRTERDRDENRRTTCECIGRWRTHLHR